MKTFFRVIAVAMFLATGVSEAEVLLQPNTEVGLKPGGFVCEQTPDEITPTGGGTGLIQVKIECAASDAAAVVRMKLVSVSGMAFNEKEAFARHRLRVDIADNSDGVEPSLLPLEVTIPVFEYSFGLINSVVGAYDGVSSISIDFRILDSGMKPIARSNVVSATNGGIDAACIIGGVASFAGGPIGAAAGSVALLECGLAGGLKASGIMNEGVRLNTLVRAGQSYYIEVAAKVFVKKRLTLALAEASVNLGGISGILNNLPTVGWNDIILKLGADPQEYIAEIEDQIDELREDLDGHSHIFLTGRGTGHNNTEAETSSALLPLGELSDDMDGVPSAYDSCPGTPMGVDVDASGCGLDSFCSMHERARDCKRADWLDDESNNPWDCRWRRSSCEVR